MKHIRYFSTDVTVCNKPNRLGYDFVIEDHAPEDSETCKICNQLLESYNKRAYELEGRLAIVQRHQPLEEDVKLTPIGALYTGLLLGSGFWIGLYVFGKLIFGLF